MELSIDEKKLSQMVADNLAKKLAPIVETAVEKYERPDKYLDAKTVYTDYLNCSPQVFSDYYLQQPGFPISHKNTQLVFSRKRLEKWMATH